MKFSHSWRRYRKAILALFFCTSLTTAQAIDFMPVNDVTTGMEGIAKTVIVGDTISTFDVKVLGVMKDKGPSGHLILAKFSGPVMDQTGGIAHGMSGSPVYINGKLVGAVAYGWGFADGTIGMITPIEDMVKLWNIPYEKNLSKPWDDTQLIPLGTPLMAYGFDAASMEYFKSKLPQYKYETYDTASASGDEIAKPLEAGGSVAALLVDGDLKLGAIGTVTHVDGEKVVAFGHPFLKHGSSNYFMHNASIFTVVKSYNAAFKLGSMGKEIGSVTEDRGAGIAGVSGVISPGIPLRFHLKDIDMGRDRTSSVKVIEDGEIQAVRNVDFHVLEGETLAIVGESGSGKSVVTKAITKLFDTNIGKIKNGEILFLGDNLAVKNNKELSEIRGKEISMIFQDPMTSLNPTMKIGKQIMEPLIYHKNLNKNDAKNRAMELLDLVGLDKSEEKFNSYPHQFSGGQRQRIVIAIVLACELKLLIADEPTTALDVTTQIQILDLMKEIQKKVNTSIIFITHDLGVVANIADRVAVMYAGEIIETGSVEEIFYDSRHPYTWGLLSSMPDLDTKDNETLISIPGTPPDLLNPPKGDAFSRRSDYALEIDFRKEPPLYAISPTHFVKSWLLDERVPEVDPPNIVKNKRRKMPLNYKMPRLLSEVSASGE